MRQYFRFTVHKGGRIELPQCSYLPINHGMHCLGRECNCRQTINPNYKYVFIDE